MFKTSRVVNGAAVALWGRGIYSSGGASFTCRDVNFSYLEVGIHIEGVAKSFISIDGIDSEHCKKLIKVSGNQTTYPLSIRNGRLVTDRAGVNPTGPVGFTDPTDHSYIDVTGCLLLLDTLNLDTVVVPSAPVLPQVRAGSNSRITAINCMSALPKPFAHQGGFVHVTSWGCTSLVRTAPDQVAFAPVLDGAYRLGNAGTLLATNFDLSQSFAHLSRPTSDVFSTDAPSAVQPVTLNNRSGASNSGQFTIAGAQTSPSAPISFIIAEADTNYRIVLSVVGAERNPALGAYVPRVVKSLTGFDVVVAAAPGIDPAGTFCTITYEWFLMR